MHYIKITLIFFSLLFYSATHAQTSKTKGSKNYPASFLISKASYDQLFLYKKDEVVSEKKNKYLDKSVLVLSTLNGDMKFLKLKLSYFEKASLLIQVNGTWSTQMFIVSDDKSVFYKGNFDKDNIVMKKCNEDDIVSE